ncbi:MAG: FAD-dependent monooxygenase [Deltaproteobacteria bacterium]|nr:FAD-dependent monooxygenase [Deltaproteobacteria bacterium]
MRPMAADFPDSVDVLVAGAGPAGLAAALDLCAAGARVLVVDARARLGHPLRCGEVTRPAALETFGLEPRPGWVRWSIRAPFEQVVLDRPRLEHDLGQIVAQRGGLLRPGTTVSAVGPFDGGGRTVTLARGPARPQVRARVVIAADGVAAGVARLAGLDTRLPLDQLAACLAYRLVDVSMADTSRFYHLKRPALHPFYFWIIPSGPREANVGLAVSARRGHAAAALLEEEVRLRPELRGGRRRDAIVGLAPSAPPLATPYADGLLVVGTAARLIDALTLEGIWHAAVSGRAAARVCRELGAQAPTAARLAPYRAAIAELYPALEAAAARRAAVEGRRER